VNEDKTGIATY